MAGKSVGFIGGQGSAYHPGRVAKGGANAGGGSRQGYKPGSLEPALGKVPRIRVVPNDNKPPASQDLVFLGLHPPAVAGCLGEIKDCLKPDAILISRPQTVRRQTFGSIGRL